MAATTRRTGTESSKTRAVLLDVTEELIRTEGYAAISSRRVASEAGVTGALVHYYFPTLDDLFVEVFRRGAEQNLERLVANREREQAFRAHPMVAEVGPPRLFRREYGQAFRRSWRSSTRLRSA